ncbi:DNA primase family protein [Candidatus Binatus sp.]|uniref:DNA primase family protein n=1 Tax=Candidatus Binatus sp. TaxID=2811406 RepID=UPI003CC51858
MTQQRAQVESEALDRHVAAINNGSAKNGLARRPPIVKLDADNPAAIADHLLKTKFMHDGLPTLIHYRGEPHLWNRNRYAVTDGLPAFVFNWMVDEVELVVSTKHGERKVAPNSRRQHELLNALAARTALDSATRPHTWLSQPPADIGKHIVALGNGLLDLGTRTLHPPTPAYFNLSSLRARYEPGADCPNWLHLLGDEMYPQDFQSIEAVQEMLGCFILPDNSHQKIFAMVGPPRSSKGTVGRVTEEMLGTESVCKLSLSDFTTDFGLEPTIGKLLAIVPDGRLDRNAGVDHAVEQLLSRSGNDSPPINRKYKSAYAGDTSTCRFLLLLNEFPTLRDSSGALASRFQLIRTFKSFLGKEDKSLFEEKLLPELDAIFLWALDGWDRLRKRGHFVVPDSAQGLLESFGEQLDKLSGFVNECAILDPKHVTEKSIVYDRYLKWAESHGQKKPWSPPAFFKALGARPGVDCEYRFNEITGSTRTPEGKTERRRVKGIRLID